ncbi:hypothetical protein AB0J47_29820 [Nocardia sp. NPDC049737]
MPELPLDAARDNAVLALTPGHLISGYGFVPRPDLRQRVTDHG